MPGSPEITDRSSRVVVAVPPHLRAQFFTAEVWRELERSARLTVIDEHTDRAAVAAALPGARALILSWRAPKVDAELLSHADRLELVAHTGSAVAPYVTEDVFRRGILVTQAGDEMARPVAEVALAFTLSLLHRVQRFDHSLRGGLDWAAASEAPPRHEIHGSDIGVIGASRTGRAYIRMARAMGARVRVTDPYLSGADARELGVESVPLETLLTGSRIVAVHAPVTEETHRMLGAEQLALMPDGAGLVNTARAWLVDQDALLAELATGRLDAALDVFDAEPLPVGHPFRSLPNVLLTPHQGAGSVECRQRLGTSAVNEVLRLLAGRPPVHAVTAEALVRLR